MNMNDGSGRSKSNDAASTRPRRSIPRLNYSESTPRSNENKGEHQCSDCGKKYSRLDSLSVHKRVAHEDNFIPCEFCPQRFSTQQALERH